MMEMVAFTLEHVVNTVRTVVGPRAASKGLDLGFELEPGLPHALQGDPLRLGLLLINYTNHAIDLSDHGSIMVRIRKIDAREAVCLLRFEVGGTGLDLATCQQLAHLMGGEADVQREPGGRSSCWLTARVGTLGAPAAPPPAGAQFRTIVQGDPAVIDLSILAKLLSDDTAKVKKFAVKFLQSSQGGFEEMETSLAAGNVQRVRELGHRIKSAARTVGALGMAELCERLEHLAPGTPAQEMAAARPIVAALWPLLAQITEHIRHTGAFSNDA